MNQTLSQIISFLLGIVFLVMAYRHSRRDEHYFSPVLSIVAAVFFMFALFSSGSFLKTVMLEQIACWVVALAFIVAAFRFLQKEKISLAFTVFILAAAFFFCSLSGIQSLLKTGMLSKVSDTLVKYGEKLDDFQMNVAKMKGDLGEEEVQIQKQEREIEGQQDRIRNAQEEVAKQQNYLNEQNSKILAIQSQLIAGQSNLDTIAGKVVTQQERVDGHQKELENQQGSLRKAQVDIATQQSDMTNQFRQLQLMQNDLAVAETNISAQKLKIESVESLINGLYSRTRVETFTALDSQHVIMQTVGNASRVFFKLNEAPVENSVVGIVQEPQHISSLNPLKLVTGIIFSGNLVAPQMPMTGIWTTNNIAICWYSVPVSKMPKDSVFILKYIKDDGATNLFKKIAIKDNEVYFDAIKYASPTNSNLKH